MTLISKILLLKALIVNTLPKKLVIIASCFTRTECPFLKQCPYKERHSFVWKQTCYHFCREDLQLFPASWDAVNLVEKTTLTWCDRSWPAHDIKMLTLMQSVQTAAKDASSKSLPRNHYRSPPVSSPFYTKQLFWIIARNTTLKGHEAKDKTGPDDPDTGQYFHV